MIFLLVCVVALEFAFGTNCIDAKVKSVPGENVYVHVNGEQVLTDYEKCT